MARQSLFLAVLFLSSCKAPAKSVPDATDDAMQMSGDTPPMSMDMPPATPVDPVVEADLTTAEASLKVVDGWFDTFTSGGSVDFNGDGKIDATIVMNPDGSKDIHVPGAHGDRSTTHWVSPTELSEEADFNDDGLVDSTMTVALVGETKTTVQTRDDDFDGEMDVRVTNTDNGNHTTYMLETKRFALDGTGLAWAISSVASSDIPSMAVGCAEASHHSAPAPTGSPSAETPGLCNGDCNFNCIVHAVNSTVAPVPGTSRLYFVTNGELACDQPHRNTITRALGGLQDALNRLLLINPIDHTRLINALAAVKVRYVCGFPACIMSSAVAATMEQGIRGTQTPIYITGLGIGPGSAPDLMNAAVSLPATQEVLFHELFHTYRHHDLGQNGAIDPNGQDQRDFIYGCSRYMVEWKAKLEYYLGIKKDASSSRDASICASMDHKMKFGHGKAALTADFLFYEVAPGDPMGLDLCTDDQDHNKPKAKATCGIERYFVYCDQTPMTDDDRNPGELDALQCATACPAGTVSDAPCLAPLVAEPTLHRVDGCLPVGDSVY